MVSLVVWVATLGILAIKNALINQYFKAILGYDTNGGDENGIIKDFKDFLKISTTFPPLVVVWLIQFFCLNSNIVFIAIFGAATLLEAVCFVTNVCYINNNYYKKQPSFAQTISFKVLRKTYPLLKDKFLFLKQKMQLCVRHETKYASFCRYRYYPAGAILYTRDNEKYEVVGFSFFDWFRAWMYFLNQERNEVLRKCSIEKAKLDSSTIITDLMSKEIANRRDKILNEMLSVAENTSDIANRMTKGENND